MGAAQVAPPEASLHNPSCYGFLYPSHSHRQSGFDWVSLPKGELVVDDRGGVGTIISVLVTALPILKFVIQDRPAVIEDGLEVRPIA